MQACVGMGSRQDHKAARVHGTVLVFVGLRYERHILYVQAGVARDEAATVVLYCSLLL